MAAPHGVELHDARSTMQWLQHSTPDAQGHAASTSACGLRLQAGLLEAHRSKPLRTALSAMRLAAFAAAKSRLPPPLQDKRKMSTPDGEGAMQEARHGETRYGSMTSAVMSGSG